MRIVNLENQTSTDPEAFAMNPYCRRIEKPWGWEDHWTPVALPYVGKIIHINSGHRLSLQIHDQKQESWYLLSGRASVIWDDHNQQLVETELESGQGYMCVPGQRHRLVGITDCDVLEVSTPEGGTTWRLEDDFNRPHETPVQRRLERNEGA